MSDVKCKHCHRDMSAEQTPCPSGNYCVPTEPEPDANVRCKHCGKQVLLTGGEVLEVGEDPNTAHTCLDSPNLRHEPADPPQTGTAETAQPKHIVGCTGDCHCDAGKYFGQHLCPCVCHLAEAKSTPSAPDGTLPPLNLFFAEFDANHARATRQICSLRDQLAAERVRAERAEAENKVLRDAYKEAREEVLHQRNGMAENGMTGEQVNDVLGVIDDAFSYALATKDAQPALSDPVQVEHDFPSVGAIWRDGPL